MFDKLDTNIIDGMERGLLSTVFFDNETIKEIKENVFSNPQYKKIFEVMNELYINKFPINEETVLAKLDNSFEQALLNIISANPISHIDSIFNSLLENNYKIFLQTQLKKIAADEPKLYIHLEHRENEALLQSPLFKNLNIKGFNTYDHAAQTLFMRLPLGGNVNTMGEETVRIAIIGADSVGISVLYRVLNLGHFYNGKPIEVTIYDEEIESKKQHFLKTYPIELDCVYWKIAFHEESVFYAQKELPYDQIIFCKRNTQQSFADAMRLVRNKASLLEHKEVFVFADSHEMIASLVDAGKEGVFKNLFTFGEFKKICAHDVIVNEALDGMAIQTNARYNDLHGYNEENLSPIQQWKNLDPFLKDSNRMQVEHLFVKLKVINKYLEEAILQGDFETIKQEAMQRWFVHGGTMLWDDIKGAKTLASYIPLDVLENLARTEKMRWNAFHILNGWQKLDIPNDAKEKVKKDKEKKLHPCLVPWEGLDHVSKNHNHDYKSDDVETVMRALEMAQSIVGTDGLLSEEIRRFERLAGTLEINN